jgi:cytochrome P450
VDRLHSVYGPIVRISPNEIHLKDPNFYDELFAGYTRRRDKYGWFVGKASGNSMFGTVQADVHRKRRAALNPFFSKKSISAIEPIIQDRTDELCEYMRQQMKSGQPMELHMAYMAVSLDIISYHAFGQSLGLLKKPHAETQKWKTAIQGAVQAAIFTRHFPTLGNLLMMMPLSFVKMTGSPAAFLLQYREVSYGTDFAIRTRLIFLQDVRNEVKAVLEKRYQNEKPTKTIFEELLTSDLPPQEKSIERLVDEGLVVMAGGGEPTAQTLAVMSFHLLNNPSILAKLKSELAEAMPDPSETLPLSRLEQLPYLKAVISESHR